MISDNPNVSLGIADCTLYNRRVALKDDFQKKRVGMIAHTSLEFKYLETLVKIFIIPARQNRFIQVYNLKKAPGHQIAVAAKTNSAFTGSYIKNPFLYQQFDLRQNRILRGGQPIVVFEAADKGCFYVTKLKAVNFQDDITSILIDNIGGH